MAEILVENQICKTCGADVRPNALFRYNCGGTVAKNVETESNNGHKADSDVFLDGNRKNEPVETIKQPRIAETRVEIREFSDAEQTKIEEPKIEKTVIEKTKVQNTKIADAKPNIINEAKLKSAASLRNKAKSFQKKEVQVVWEEPENASGTLLILIALLLTVFAAVVVFLAISLK